MAIKDKLRQFAAQMFMTKLGWMINSFIWLIIWTAVYNNVDGEWPFWVMLPALVYLVGITLVFIVFAWIINPIRDWKARKKNEKRCKEK